MIGIDWLARAFIYPRGFPRPDPRGAQAPGLERWWIDSDQGDVETWFLPAEVSPAPAVIFAHGNGELIDQWPDALSRYRSLGLHLVLPEYRGYGRSAGTPSETAIATDFVAVHSRLIADPRVDASRLVYHGRSLGGGAACGLASQIAPAALILESTFTSLADVVRSLHLPAFLVPDRFDNEAVLARLDVPVLLFHGRNDTVVPVAHAHRLQAARPDAELVLYDCGHNDLPPSRTHYWSRIEAHLARAGVSR